MTPVQDASLESVMSRLRQGDQDAATLIFHRFVNRLTALASRQFDARFRAKTDAEDVVQSVYKSFFLRDGRSPFDLSDWDSLWSLLATITIRKCHDKRSFWLAARRSVGREFDPKPTESRPSGWESLDRSPTPLEATVLAEILETILGELTPQHRSIAELSFQGFTALEAAAQCQCSERTVGRVIARIKDRLKEIDSDGQSD